MQSDSSETIGLARLAGIDSQRNFDFSGQNNNDVSLMWFAFLLVALMEYPNEKKSFPN